MQATTSAPSSLSPIWARGLAKSFGTTVAVDGLDLAVERGTCLGLLGPNGAGKTTTIEILEGLTAPDRGEVAILGLAWRGNGRTIRARIGVQLQETTLPDKLKVFEVLRAFASFYRGSRGVGEMLELLGLAEKRSALVSELSGGQRQRLSLGCALVHRPEVLFLDEPTTGLDPQARRRVWEVVEEFKGAGGTVLLTTHHMEEAERLADELLIVDHGKSLARGTPRAIVASLGAEIFLELDVCDSAGTPRPGALDEPSLRALPGVISVANVEARARLGAKSLERTLPALLETLGARGLSLADLSVHRPTLEDVFVSLTGRQLRDA